MAETINNTSQPLQASPLLLSDAQAAELLNVPAGTVRYLHRMHQLRGIVVGHHLRFAPEAVHAYVQRVIGEARR